MPKLTREQVEREIFSLLKPVSGRLTPAERMDLSEALIDLITLWLGEGLSRQEILRRLIVMHEDKHEPWMDEYE